MTIQATAPYLTAKRKDELRAIHVNGFCWGGYDHDTGLHIFQRRVGLEWKFEHVLATEQDLADGNFEWMAQNGYTRPPCYRESGDVCTHGSHVGWFTL